MSNIMYVLIVTFWDTTCHVTVYTFQVLVTLIRENMLQQRMANIHTVQALASAIDQRANNKQHSQQF